MRNSIICVFVGLILLAVGCSQQFASTDPAVAANNSNSEIEESIHRLVQQYAPDYDQSEMILPTAEFDSSGEDIVPGLRFWSRSV